MLNNRRRSIVISTYDDVKNPYYGGGGAIAIHELAKRLTSLYQVVVVSWNHSGEKKEIIDSVQYSRIGSSNIHPKLAMLIFQWMLPVLSIVKKYDIWIESFGPPFTTSFLPVFTKKPVIGILHMLAAGDMKRKYNIDLRFIENKGLRQYKNIIVTSESMQKKIQSLCPETECQVISNGITHIMNTDHKKKKQILFIGRIEINQKGVDLLLQAFEQFTKESKEKYQLVIAGSGIGSELQKLALLIKDREIKKRIIFKGRVEGKEKDKLMKESLCLVVPSRFETYSMVTLEAMAYGMPVVSFDIEGLRWTPPGLVKKVPPYDTFAMSMAIKEVIENLKIRGQMRKKGVQYAKNFSWDQIVENYKEIIEKNVVYAG